MNRNTGWNGKLFTYLSDNYKVLLTVEGMREWYFNDEKTIIYSDRTKIWYIKYHDTPLPYSIDYNTLVRSVNPQLVEFNLIPGSNNLQYQPITRLKIKMKKKRSLFKRVSQWKIF